MKRPRWFTLSALAGLAVLAGLAAPAFAADEGEGRAIYDQACAACHQADAKGIPGSFPPLAGNPNVADVEYVKETIRNGKTGVITVNGETYDAVMAPITTLTDDQVAEVAAYVAGLAGAGSGGETTPPPAAPTEGDAAHGESLFLGGTVLANGGPACAACHAAGTANQLGGPGLGPDLTDMYARFGGATGVAAALATPPSATMTPLFADRPLTETEIADLTAFFADVDADGAATGPDILWLVGLLGAVALVIFLAVAVRKPSGTYLESLRSSR